MDDNPFKSPAANDDGKPKQRPVDYMWPLIGFALGTGLVGLLVLSTDIRIRGLTGMLCGGLPFGILGLWYAFRRAGRKWS